MYVIGTAGHVDHGKSALVAALTGIHPDRLQEEREREMTIDLGFAWLTLPNGEPVGVIDVPGHRDFIENMLAGVGGIDAAILVVAADEGVMPQTREHLAILDLLQIQSGLIALTKADLVEEDWLELVKADVRAVVGGTVLAEAPLLAVSARSGAGLDQLKHQLQLLLAARPQRRDLGRPRLPIDRVFSLAGFGTIVTGTLSDGALAVGDEVEILPAGLTARVRGLQTHKTKLERATPGRRLAVNVTGLEVNQLQRGQVLAHPQTLRPTTLVSARFRHLPEAGLPLKHNAQVKFFVGAAEVVGHVRLLDPDANTDALAPGATAWIQLALTEPVVAVKGDHFILRRPSPGATIGGGVIIDPQAARLRRREPAVIARLETLARGTPGEILLQSLDALGPASIKEAIARAALDATSAEQALAEVRLGGDLIQLDGEGLALSRSGWKRFEQEVHELLGAYHATHPVRAGMPREEAKSRLAQSLERGWVGKLTPRVFNALVERALEAGWLLASGTVLALATHRVTFSPAQHAKVEALLSDFQRDPYNTPSVKDSAMRVGDEVLAALLEQGRLTQVSADVLFLSETYTALVERIQAHLRANGKITVAEVRDLFTTSRKYALALMEHLDALGVTKRVGDERVLKNQ
jgi:selenocysteine-specific elongation factor